MRPVVFVLYVCRVSVRVTLLGVVCDMSCCRFKWIRQRVIAWAGFELWMDGR